MFLRQKPNGSLLGRLFDEHNACRQAHYQNPAPAIKSGASDAGQGIGLTLTNPPAIPGSFFILDPKAESSAVTARARQIRKG